MWKGGCEPRAICHFVGIRGIRGRVPRGQLLCTGTVLESHWPGIGGPFWVKISEFCKILFSWQNLSKILVFSEFSQTVGKILAKSGFSDKISAQSRFSDEILAKSWFSDKILAKSWLSIKVSIIRYPERFY